MKVVRTVRYESSNGEPLTGDQLIEAIRSVRDELGPEHELRLHGERGQTYKVEGSRVDAPEPEAGQLPPYTWAVHSQACQDATGRIEAATTVTCRCIVVSGATYRLR